jgi:hypothetical protein
MDGCEGEGGRRRRRGQAGESGDLRGREDVGGAEAAVGAEQRRRCHVRHRRGHRRKAVASDAGALTEVRWALAPLFMDVLVIGPESLDWARRTHSEFTQNKHYSMANLIIILTFFLYVFMQASEHYSRDRSSHNNIFPICIGVFIMTEMT